MEQIDSVTVNIGPQQFASLSQSHAAGLGIYICADTPYISACIKVQASIPSALSVADAESHALLPTTHMFDQLQINSCTLSSDNMAVVQAIDATDSYMPSAGWQLRTTISLIRQVGQCH